LTKDRVNSTRELISASETVMASCDYDLWGTPTETHLSGNVSTMYRGAGTGEGWSAPDECAAGFRVAFPVAKRTE